MPMDGDGTDPRSIRDRADFVRALNALRRHSGKSIRELARLAGLPPATVGGYFSGRHLPTLTPPDALVAIVRVCGVESPDERREWIAAAHRARGLPAERGAPYRGLEPFGPDDGRWFFGRDDLIARLVEVVGREVTGGGLSVVLGASGSGKSSLVRAGLVRAVRDGALAGLDTALIVTPADNPDLDQPAPLLVVDQFEEVFTALDDDRRRDFVRRLVARAARAGHAVVLAVRADFYAACAGIAELVPALQEAQVVVGAMSAAQLREVIVEPARLAGSRVEEALVTAILAEVQDEPGALPLLSYALLATWQSSRGTELTVDGYRRTGGLHDAVARTAERVHAELTETEQLLARRVFLRLVSVEADIPTTRTRIALADLDGAGPDAASTRAVVDVFVANRLLTAGEDSVSVSHEALLTAWPRLQGWIEDSRAQLQTYASLRRAARDWDRAQHDDSALLTGARLAAVQDWASDPDTLSLATPHEREFLDRSRLLAEQHRRREARQSRRLRRLLVALLATLLVVAVLAGYSLRARAHADHDADLARQARDNAIAAQEVFEADRVRATDPALAGLLSVAAYRLSPQAQERAAVLDTSASPTPTRLVASDQTLEHVAVDAAGRTMAVVGDDGQVRVWSMAGLGSGPAPATVRAGPGALYADAISGHDLVVGGSNGLVDLYRLGADGRPTLGSTLSGARSTVYALAFTPDGSTILAGTDAGTVERWSAATGARLPAVAAGRQAVQGIAVSPDGTLLAAGGHDGMLRLWRDPSAPRPAPVAAAPTGRTIWSVAFAPDGGEVAAGGDDGSVRRWRTAGGRGLLAAQTLSGFTSNVKSVVYTADGRRLIAGSADDTTRSFSLDDGATATQWGSPGPVTSVATAPGGDRVVTVGGDGVVRLYDLDGPVLPGFATGSVFALGVDRDGGRALAASSSTQGHVVVYAARPSTTGWSIADQLRVPADDARVDGSAAISPDGRLVAAGTVTDVVRLWSVDPAGAAHLLPVVLGGPTALIEQLAFSADGRSLFASDDDGRVYHWDVGTPADPVALPTLTGGRNLLLDVAVSPDGRTVAAADADDDVDLWTVADPQHPRQLPSLAGFGNYAYAVAFSPDGSLLGAGSADRTARIWNVRDPARPVLLSTMGGPQNFVFSVAFSPDASQFAMGSTDGTVWLYDTHDPAHPVLDATLLAATGHVYSVDFDPAAPVLMAGTSAHAVTLWSTDPAADARRICADAGTGLTPAEWARYVPGLPYRNPCAS